MRPRNVVLCFAIAFLLATAAHCQSLKTQKACYDQALKVAETPPSGAIVKVMANHYDARSKTCWVKQFWQLNDMTVNESVYNAFEPGVFEAEYGGIVWGGPGTLCFVHNVLCNNMVEFERLAVKYYGF
jgi:hypothetical protein